MGLNRYLDHTSCLVRSHLKGPIDLGERDPLADQGRQSFPFLIHKLSRHFEVRGRLGWARVAVGTADGDLLEDQRETGKLRPILEQAQHAHVAAGTDGRAGGFQGIGRSAHRFDREIDVVLQAESSEFLGLRLGLVQNPGGPQCSSEFGLMGMPCGRPDFSGSHPRGRQDADQAHRTGAQDQDATSRLEVSPFQTMEGDGDGFGQGGHGRIEIRSHAIDTQGRDHDELCEPARKMDAKEPGLSADCGATGSTTISYILPGGIYWRVGPAGPERYLAARQFLLGCVIMPAALTFVFLK